MTDPFADWPPIIRSAKRSPLILWRDVLLTLLMWGVMFAILYSELAFALSALDVMLGRSDAEIDAGVDLFLRQMRPLMILIGALVMMLAIATIASRRRRSEALLAKQPAPLSIEEVAAIAGMDVPALAATWPLKRAIVARHATSLRVIAAPDTPAETKGDTA